MRDRFYTPPIPNGWFQVAYSGEFAHISYFDRSLILHRTEQGEPKLLDACA
jgi:hypothetical protein